MATPSFKEPSEAVIKRLSSLINVEARFRAVYDRLSCTDKMLFLAVAKKPGEGPGYYAQQVGIVKSLASRQMLILGDRDRDGDDGFGLISSVVHETDLRAKRYYLTEKGQFFIDRVIEDLS